jgi:hypothetical protein
MSNYCIYRHIRLDTNQVFYIGIGDPKRRPYTKSKRNTHWKNITNKTKYEIQILKSDLSWEDACELEIILISYYGRHNNKTGILCNMTNGGEGCVGQVVSKEHRDKLSKANKDKIILLKNKENLSNLFSYKIINIITKDIYKNINYIKDLTKYSLGSMKLKLRNKSINNTPFMYLKDYEKLSNYELDEHLKNKLKYNHRKVINNITNVIYSSILEASIKENINKSTLQSKLSGYRTNNTNLQYYEV